ncbi:MAG TPA: hypothetical protein RMH99_00640 [Sandaracinaceae bacterium LLY-WYZ-13_1]|nr:hypothetical protein [Sandaracinaceae bacterium LLY-WYZ-13_1]
MGATSFITTAHGRTAKEAFRAAAEDARHWHGHDGYTGTVAEKVDFVMISDTAADVKARVDQAIEGLREIQSQIRQRGRADMWTWFRVRAVEQSLSLRVGVRRHILDEGTAESVLREFAEAIGRLSSVSRRCRATMRPAALATLLLDIHDTRIDDKWGPAGCIDIAQTEGRDTEFLFFGVASC